MNNPRKFIRKAFTFRASSIGDALNAKYLLENIHAAYPDARCGIVVAGRGAMVRDLLAAYPWIEIIEANRRDLRSLLKLWGRFYGSDLVVTPITKPGGRFALPSKIAARLLARPGGLIGFRDEARWSRFLYDRMLPAAPTRAPRLLEQDILAAAAIPVRIPDMRLRFMPQPTLLLRLGLTEKQYLVLHLFAGSPSRAISQEKRQALIDALASALPSIPLLLTGTNADRPFLESLTLPATAHVAAGELSVQELAALIEGSGCMVSIGTGPSHMASSIGTPLLVLVTCIGRHWCGVEEFGANAADRIFSATAACAEGHDFGESFARCIEGIDVGEVAKAAMRYFPHDRN